MNAFINKELNDAKPGLLLAYLPFALWSPHFETELEIIQKHLDKGGRVEVLSCNCNIHVCDPNPGHNLIICGLCQTRFKTGMKWVRGSAFNNESFYSLTREEKSYIDILNSRVWVDLNDVASFSINGADIGLAALSSIVSILRESEPDIRNYQGIIKKHIETAATVYFSIKNQLKKKNPDQFLLFNGRLSAMRPALRAAQELGIHTLVEERAGELDRYKITVNTYPHDREKIKSEIETLYNESNYSDEIKRKLAMSWFEECRSGLDKSWSSFTKTQKKNKLPEGFSNKTTNVVIFNSSEDEYVTIKDWVNPFYANQNDGIDRLMEDLSGIDNLRVFLRVHPNLKGLNNTQIKGINAISKKHEMLYVIPADSEVSSYALIDAADIVVTYSSTIGIEASYAGKLSILMGNAHYEDLGVCIRPDSHDDFISFLRDIATGNKLPVPYINDLGIIKYGFYKKMCGEKFTYVRPKGIFSADLIRDNKITTLKSNIVTRVGYRLYRECNGLLRKTGICS